MHCRQSPLLSSSWAVEQGVGVPGRGGGEGTGIKEEGKRKNRGRGEEGKRLE